MKILAYSCYYTPEIAASLYLTEDIYKGFADAGHVVDVYVPMPTRGISEEVRKEYKGKRIEKKHNGRVTIHRISMYRENKNSISRAFRYFLVNVAFLWKGLRTKSDVIFVQSTPPTQGMMAGILSILKKTPVVYNLQDIFPDSLVNTGITRQGSLLWKIGRRIEDFSYRAARKIVVISEDFKRNIMAKGVPEEKIEVIPNWADCDGVYPVDRKDNVLIDRYGLDANGFYITYSGNIGMTQNMDLLLEVAKKIGARQHDIHFVIIGEGTDKARVQNRVDTEDIDNVMLLPFQPYDDIAHVFSLGDIGLLISKPGVGNNSVPSKTWGIMAAGKPVLASFDKDSELVKLISRHHLGLVADNEDPDDMADKIINAYNHRAEMEKMGEQGMSYVKNELNRDKCLRKLTDILRELE